MFTALAPVGGAGGSAGTGSWLRERTGAGQVTGNPGPVSQRVGELLPLGAPWKCRTVWVPQDWAHPHGRQIPLTVAVLPVR